MRHFTLAACAALLLAGCGTTHHTAQHAGTPLCQPRHPAAGEAVKCAFPPKVGATPTAIARGKPCADVSQWQGATPNLTGLRCVIIQANAGGFINPFLGFQVADANAHRVPWGGYTYLECGFGAGEAQTAIRATDGKGRTLGIWADAEIGCAYSHACGYIEGARNAGIHIYGLYSAPGLWPGGHCAGYLWPAEWSGSGAYPFGGYPASAILIRQWCGTCFRYGVETDLDEDRGLIALGHPTPKPTRQQLERELHVHVAILNRLRAQVNHLRVKLSRYGCARRRSRHEMLGPRCTGWFVAGGRVHAHIRVEERLIARIRHELGLKGVQECLSHLSKQQSPRSSPPPSRWSWVSGSCRRTTAAKLSRSLVRPSRRCSRSLTRSSTTASRRP